MLNDFSWIIRSSFQFSPAWSQHVWLPFLPFLRLEQAFNISNFNKYNKAFKQWWIQHRQVIFYRKMAAHRKEDKILLRTIHKFHSLIKTFNIPWYFFWCVFYSSINLWLLLVLPLLPIKSGKRVIQNPA